jgi:hypothetical protein
LAWASVSACSAAFCSVMSVDDVLQKLAAFPQQHGAANGSRIFDGDAEKGIRQPAIADLFRDEPKRFRAPLQVMRFVRKLHREMPIAAKAVCGVIGGNSWILWRRSRD